MPICLKLIDDYETPKKVIGLTALKHIIEEVDASQLSWFGIPVLQALRGSLVFRTREILSLVLPTLSLCLKMIDDPNELKLKINIFDEIVKEFTRAIDTSREIPLVAKMSQLFFKFQVYVDNAIPFFDMLGIHLVRYFKELMPAVYQYMEHEDTRIKIKSLDLLLVIVTNCWPRMYAHVDQIMKHLMEVCCSSSSLSEKRKKEIYGRIEKILIYLKEACPDQFQIEFQKCVKEKFPTNKPSFLESIK